MKNEVIIGTARNLFVVYSGHTTENERKHHSKINELIESLVIVSNNLVDDKTFVARVMLRASLCSLVEAYEIEVDVDQILTDVEEYLSQRLLESVL